MHELSIVEALIEQVGQELDRAGQPGRAAKLELSIGLLSGVNCDSLRFAFDLLSPGTRVEGAEVVIDEPKPTCHCRSCNSSRQIDELTPHCPACGSDDILIEGGREMLLQSIEIEDQDD